MEDVLQVPVSRGCLAKRCTGTISAALQNAFEELTESIPTRQQLGSDETSIKDKAAGQNKRTTNPLFFG